MSARRRTLYFALCSLCLAGCSVVGSAPPASSMQKAQVDQSGVLYMLPRALLEFTLKEQGGRFTLDVGQPEFVGDPKHVYILHYDASPFAKDTLTINVSQKNLLTTVNAKAEDKTDDALVNLAKSVAAIAEAAPAGDIGEVILLRKKIDPANENEVASLRADVARVIKTHARRQAKKLCGNPDNTLLAACKAYELIEAKAVPVEISIPKPETFRGGAADCSVGICYRPTLPYTIGIQFADATVFSTVVALPNDAPAVALSVERAIFVTRETKISLSDGMLTGVSIEKESEAVDAALLPFRIMKAPLEAASEILPLKIDVSQKEAELIRKETELKKLQAQLAKEQAGKMESAVRTQQGTPILSASNELPVPSRSRLPREGENLNDNQPGKPPPDSTGLGNGLPEDPNQ